MSSDFEVPSDNATSLALAFAGLGPSYFKWMQSRCAVVGVSFPRLKLLGALHKRGPQIMSELSDDLGVTPRNVTALVDALEKEGLVRRLPHQTDRRATIVELTEQGAGLGLRMASGRLMEAVGELFHDLTAEEQQQLLAITMKLQASLASRGFGGGCPAAAEVPQ